MLLQPMSAPAAATATTSARVASGRARIRRVPIRTGAASGPSQAVTARRRVRYAGTPLTHSRGCEVDPRLPHRVERDPEEGGERGMLDDDDGQLVPARDRVLEAEHRDPLIDDRELERQLVDDPSLLAGADEALDRLDRVGVLEERPLVDAARRPALEQPQTLDVLRGRR